MPATVNHLRAGGVSLVVEAGPGLPPRVLHWGADLGELEKDELAQLARGEQAGPGASVPDGAATVTLLPQESQGWPGTPGLRGHRGGPGAAHLLTPTGPARLTRAGAAQAGKAGTGAGELTIELTDQSAGLAATVTLALDGAGLLELRCAIVNRGPDDYLLDSLLPALPLPATASELLDFTGRWSRERAPQRGAIRTGVHRHEGRHGRTGFDAAPALIAGTAGFGFQRGEVWGLHTAWSGNHVTFLERTASGAQLLGGGELLAPGEVVLRPGERYESPRLLASYGRGLDEMSARYHAWVRACPGRVTGPRPVVMNTWEAVYFRQDLATLKRLAELGAQVGAGLFVLDDGWFLGRRDDRAGLGDWVVDPAVWPHGLSPLIDHVLGLGMRFGLWAEPEMVSPDSELARAHPEWIAAPPGRLPLPGRHQQVLNLAIPGAYEHVAGQLGAILDEYPVSYLKWDHNRDLTEAGFAAGPGAGRPAVHAQTRACYRLMDELKARHPGLTIESCASGGGRGDLEMLRRAGRMWGSDCIDALERQSIQRFTSLSVPPELIGSHVGAAVSHTTGRHHSLDFRCGTAFFASFGIEADLTQLDEAELQLLAEWVALYRRFAPLIAQGTTVRADTPAEGYWLHGIVAPDRREALYQYVALTRIEAMPPGVIALPGLDGEATYRVRPCMPEHSPTRGATLGAPPWWDDGVALPGRVLGEVGLQAPALFPEQLAMIHVEAV